MITVIFEVTLKKGMKDIYLKMASNLADELAKQQGFISLERFTIVDNDNKMISLQLWKDEKAIETWRENEKHKRTMPIGYDKVFKDYKLTVLTSIRSYGKYDRGEAPIQIPTNKNSTNEN